MARDHVGIETMSGSTRPWAPYGGVSSVGGSETVTSTTYTTLPTPDQVAGIVTPASGLVAVVFSGGWKESVAGAGRAAIFVDGNQLLVGGPATSGTGLHPLSSGTQAAATNSGGTSGVFAPLFTHSTGLASTPTYINGWLGDLSGTAMGFAATITASVVQELAGSVNATALPISSGGPCYIYMTAGTHTISIQFKSSSGTISSQGRKLWVWSVF